MLQAHPPKGSHPALKEKPAWIDENNGTAIKEAVIQLNVDLDLSDFKSLLTGFLAHFRLLGKHPSV